MLRHTLGLLLGVGLLCNTAVAEAPVTPSRAIIEQQLTRFEQQAGVTHWPQLQGCAYAPFGEAETVGLWMKVGGPLPWDKTLVAAQGRWDGHCHVPVKHVLLNWPEGKPGGVYLVAVRQAPGLKAYERPDYRLQVQAVFDALPVDEAVLEAMMRRVCSHPEPTDRDCQH
jgi:hypothetical protein